MNDGMPIFLKEKSKIINVHRESDGAFSLKLRIEIQGQTEFVPFLSYRALTDEEKSEKKWIIDFKKRHADLWAKGYDLTSREMEKGTMYGCTKDGEYIDLELYKSGRLQFIETPYIVKVKSLILKKEFEIFNSLLCGYDALIAADKPIKQQPIKFRKKSRCRICGCEKYKMYVNIHNTGEKDLIEKQPDKNINKDNWTDAFDWISIDLECVDCGRMLKNWFEMETM